MRRQRISFAVIEAGLALFAALGLCSGESRGADGHRGEAAFTRQCALCHTIGKGEPNRFGPNLFGILDRKAGTAANFKYSPAFKSAASWDWNADALRAWIEAPEKMVPGTTMGVFQGVATKDSNDIMAYLEAHR
jgi:cytochrome c